MKARNLLPLAAAALALASAAPASADTLLAPAPGAKNLVAGGGYLAWAAPTADGHFKLVVRAPDGTVTDVPVAPFATAPDPSIGSDRFGVNGRKTLLVYSRCSDTATLVSCDIYSYDLNRGTGERKVTEISSRFYGETAPSISLGRWTFVRRGGANNGVYVRTGNSRPRRLSRTIATETATNGTRVAYAHRTGLVIRRLSGKGRALVALRGIDGAPTSITLTRYNAAWLLPDGRLQRTERFAGSGGPYTLKIANAHRQPPEGTDSVAVGQSILQHWFLDREGVKRPDPPLLKP